MHRRRGFTILELLIIMAIIGIIAAIAIPSFLRARETHDQNILFGEQFLSLTLPPTPQQRVILQPLVTERLHRACGNRLAELGPAVTDPPTTDPREIQRRLLMLSGVPPEQRASALPDCGEIKPLADKYGFLTW